MLDFIVLFLTVGIPLSSALLLASLGETVNQRSGVFNLGCEGVMSMGAFVGMLIPFMVGGAGKVSWVVNLAGLLAAALVGALLGLLFGVVVIKFGAPQGIAGIGTVTFYDPDTGKFGALGHGVSETGGGLLNMKSGNAYDAAVLSVKRGKCGEPGQLKGTADPANAIGTLLRNTPQGVFGVTKQGWKGEPLPVATCEEVHTGRAAIRSTVESDTPRDYSVEILKIYPKDRADGRNLLLKVTDPKLLETTGGIVQGMSGSPIIQDGRLIGAVTHVLVNQPDTGYGIFIENMLEAAQ